MLPNYAIFHDCPRPDGINMFSIVAQHGQLQVLEYLKNEYGRRIYYDWDEETCSIAAQYGHLDCLQYLRENG